MYHFPFPFFCLTFPFSFCLHTDAPNAFLLCSFSVSCVLVGSVERGCENSISIGFVSGPFGCLGCANVLQVTTPVFFGHYFNYGNTFSSLRRLPQKCEAEKWMTFDSTKVGESG